NVWIALLDQAGRLVTTAEAGMGEAFLPLVRQLNRGELLDCAQMALAQAQVVVREEPPTTCTDCPLAASYAGRGAMTVRLEHGTKIYGLLCASVPIHHIADKEEHALLREVAGDIAVALHNIELEEERKRAETERQAHLRFLESMEQVNRAMQGANDLEQMMSDVLDVVLSVFNCDRVFLLYPCDPESPSWSSPMERSKPEYPGVLALGLELPMDAEVAETLCILLDSDGPVKFGPGSNYSLPTDVSERFALKSFMSMALRPKVGKPWQFGIHQCSYARIWTVEEERLFQEIGRRLSDTLTSMLTWRSLCESEARYRRIVDMANEGIWVLGEDLMTILVNARTVDMLGYSCEEMLGRPVTDFMFAEDVPDHLAKMENRRRGVSENYERRFRRKDGKTVWTLASAAPIFDDEHHFQGTFAMLTEITERKLAEEALHESEQKLRTIFGTVEEALSLNAVVVDDQGEIIDYEILEVNPAFEQDTGLTREQAIGKKATELYGMSPEYIHAFWKDHLHDERTVKTDMYVDRTQAWKHISTSVPVDGQFVISFSDITDLKNAETALRESEQKFRSLVEESSEGFTLVDEQGTIIEWNRARERMTGLAANEVIGRAFWDVQYKMFPPELRTPQHYERAKQMVLDALRTGQSPLFNNVIESEAMRQDGARRFVQQTIFPIKTDRGYRIGSITRDVTERKRAEEALKESEAKYMDLYENAPDMYASVNAQTGLIEQCNHTLANALGYAKEKIIGQPAFEIYHPDYLEEAKKTFKLFIETGEVHDKELQLRAKDGSRLDVSLNVSSVRDQDGNILYSRSTLRDITERKRHDAIRASRLHLMQFAATHSLEELLEETLNEAEKLGDSLIGFYHFVEDDEVSLILQNWSTRTKAEFCRAEGKGLHYAISEAGVWVDCVYQRKPVIHNDYASLPHRKGVPDGHAAVIRELVVPVLRGEKVKAILGVGNKPSNYSSQDVEAISLLADLAWEIAERKLAEETRHRLNRELQALSDCNQVLLRAVDEQTLLDEICRIICDVAGYRLAWVGYAERDDAKTVRPVAWAGFDSAYVANAKLSWSDDTERGRGPAGKVIRSGEIVYVQDFDTAPEMAPWRESALQRGYRSGIALPLKGGNAQVFGVVLIYHSQPNAMTPSEVRLMAELADDLAFGITVLRTRAERKRMEQALILREKEYRTLVEHLPDLIVRYDTNLRRIYVNPAWEKASGLSAEEVIHVDVTDIPKVPKPVVVGYADKIRAVMETGASQTIGFSWVNAYGETLFLEYTLVPEYDQDGKIGGVLSVGHDLSERKRAEDALQQRASQLALLNEIGRRVAALLDLDEVLDRAAHLVQELFGFHHVGLFTQAAGEDRL
ncbi:MAG: PAS domain S-box protein, partial [Verrucomicrobia bacterium]|nr:PAS domain S-box protein [Verrucomicrobiota bacterium]